MTQVTISNLEKGKGARRETRRKLVRALEIREENLLLATPPYRAAPAITPRH